jgi:hypothetical protein
MNLRSGSIDTLIKRIEKYKIKYVLLNFEFFEN